MAEKCVLILEPEYYSEAELERIKAAGFLPIFKDCSSQEELVTEIESLGAENYAVAAIFAKLGLKFNRELFEACSGELKWLITPTTGLNHIELEALEQLGVNLLSLKGQSSFLEQITPTAELVFALLLALLREIPAAHNDVLAGNWQRRGRLGKELKELKLGIVGLGRLGTMVAGYGRAFGMFVSAFDEKEEVFKRTENSHVMRNDSLKELLGAADVVSIHLPWNERTKGMFNAGRFKQFKRGAYLINTARGELIDEEALLKALNEGILAGCGLDVLNGDSCWEEIPQGHPLVEYARTHDNLIITPHTGGYTINAILKTRAFMIEQFLKAQQS